MRPTCKARRRFIHAWDSDPSAAQSMPESHKAPLVPGEMPAHLGSQRHIRTRTPTLEQACAAVVRTCDDPPPAASRRCHAVRGDASPSSPTAAACSAAAPPAASAPASELQLLALGGGGWVQNPCSLSTLRLGRAMPLVLTASSQGLRRMDSSTSAGAAPASCREQRARRSQISGLQALQLEALARGACPEATAPTLASAHPPTRHAASKPPIPPPANRPANKPATLP